MFTKKLLHCWYPHHPFRNYGVIHSPSFVLKSLSLNSSKQGKEKNCSSVGGCTHPVRKNKSGGNFSITGDAVLPTADQAASPRSNASGWQDKATSGEAWLKGPCLLNDEWSSFQANCPH